MMAFDISEQCKKEWDQSMDVSSYPPLDKELYDAIYSFVCDRIDLLDDPSKHQKTLEYIVKKLAAHFNVRINDIIIVANEDKNIFGGYDKESKNIVFNFSKKNLMGKNNINILSVIVHELRHAVQQQKYRYSNSEFGRAIDDSITNYTKDTESLSSLSLYYGNFIEVDAENFAYKYTLKILRDLRDIKKMDIGLFELLRSDLDHEYRQIQTSQENAEQLIKNHRKYYEITCELFKRYVDTILTNKDITKEKKDEEFNKLLSNVKEIIEGNGQDLFGLSRGNILYLKQLMFENVDPLVIAENLDTKFMRYLEYIEDKTGDFGLIGYEKYSRKISNTVQKCEQLLDLYKIEYDKNDKAGIVKKTLEVLPNLILENIGKPRSHQISTIEDTLLSLATYFPKYHKKLSDITIGLIEESIPQEELIKYLEESSKDNRDCYCGPYEVFTNLLDGYRNFYGAEQIFHSNENLLKYLGIKFDSNNCYEIREKVEANSHKFLLKCLLKNKFTNEEKNFIFGFEAGNYLIDPKALEKAIKSNIFIIPRINKLLKENNHPVLKVLEKRGIDLKEMLKVKKAI